MKNKHLGTAAWIIGGQAATAIGTVVGIRLLTQILTPSAYGTLSLSIGIAGLALNVLCTPLTQATAHFYPGISRNAPHLLSLALSRILRDNLRWFASIVILGWCGYIYFANGSPTIAALLTLVFICDCWRSYRLVIINAEQDHRTYALWMSLDAWGRPILACVLVHYLSDDVRIVLSAYVIVSIGLTFLFVSTRRPDSAPDPGVITEQEVGIFSTRMRTYALPLVPLGLIGWANGLGDRYVIGSLLTVADAGLYAAAYGLASRPVLIANATVEQALRPLYQDAVTHGEHDRARHIILLWFATMLSISGCLVLLMTVFNAQIAALLLGPNFRGASRILPWVACGYGLLTLSYVFERVCYAHGRTARVLAIQSCTALTALVTTAFGAWHWGLSGSAMAVPVYFTVQLVGAMIQAARTTRREQVTPSKINAAETKSQHILERT